MPDSKKNEIALKEAEQILSNKNYDANYANKQMNMLANGKYRDDPEMISLIYKHLHSQLRIAYVRAQKIWKIITEKYPNSSYKEVIDLIHRYQGKYNFSNTQRDLTIRIVSRSMKFSSLFDEKNAMPHTAISKALGFKPQLFDYQTGDMSVESSQMVYVDKIIKLYNENVLLHNRVQLQVYTHEEKNFCYITYPLDVNSTDVYSFVPTYLFALFGPKFDDIENRMLFASISKIINLRKEGMPLETKSEVELFEDICRDPVETQCTTNIEPFKDLYKRCEVQKSLWECVLNLRNGKYSTNESYVFQKSLEFCKNVVYDNPEYAFVKDAGYDLQKLFNCFSFRPIMYSSDTTSKSLNNNLSMMQTSSHFSVQTQLTVPNPISPIATGMKRFDFKPMIMVNPNMYNTTTTATPNDPKFNLQDVLTFEHKHLSIKNKYISVGIIKIENCISDILVFYVPRKKIKNEIEYSYPSSMKITSLPVSMVMYEEIDMTLLEGIHYDEKLKITQGNSAKTTIEYQLASAVFFQTTKIKNPKYSKDSSNLNHTTEQEDIEIIIGTSAFVSDRSHASDDKSCGFVYSPYNPVCKLDVTNGKFNPVKALGKDKSADFMNFDLKRKGTLFLYKRVDSSNSCNVTLGTA